MAAKTVVSKSTSDTCELVPQHYRHILILGCLCSFQSPSRQRCFAPYELSAIRKLRSLETEEIMSACELILYHYGEQVV